MTRLLRRGWRPLLGVGLLALLVHHLGAAPFLAGLRAVDAGAVAAGLLIGAGVTVCAAWRWRLVARGLGAELGWRTAVAGCYRSQLLNCVLPGGVLGDVHRGVVHGRAVGDLGRGLRGVAWDRVGGQAVQSVATVSVLLALPSPVRPWVGPALGVTASAAVLVAAALRLAGPRLPERLARISRLIGDDARRLLRPGRDAMGMALASLGVLAGCAGLLLVAARAAGSTASPATLLPLALLVLLAMTLPFGVGGWGPREGAAAALFGLAGLGAAQGVATATVYGVLVTVGALPGLLALRPGRAAARPPAGLAPALAPAAPGGGVARG